MADNIQGQAVKLGDNINTDIISPPQYMECSIEEAAKYAMSAVRPDFYDKMIANPGSIIVAGNNFGSGSSRETSPLTLKYLGTGAIVAKFFARIFYRNSINLGLIPLECKETDRIQEGDELEIDYRNGVLKNITRDEQYSCSKIPDHIMEIIRDGGLAENLKKKMRRKQNV